MKLSAPLYYRDFACIADRCRHSCCVGWEIDVDDETIKKYDRLDGGMGEKIRGSISYEGTPHFVLTSTERCPHLNATGLCEIILHCGENCLCDICREHPRFYHQTSNGLEVGIGMACEEAARIILHSACYDEFISVGETDENDLPDWDATELRKKLYAVLSESSIPYTARLKHIYHAYGISPSQSTDEQWKELLCDLEYLVPEHKDLFNVYSSDLVSNGELDSLLERALAYFIFRHCSAASDEEEQTAALGFCLFCERLLASLLRTKKDCTYEDATELARILSEEIEYSEDNTNAIQNCFFNI